MNRIYSKVWNKTLGQWVVASELARSDGGGSAVKGGRRKLQMGLLSFAVAMGLQVPPRVADAAAHAPVDCVAIDEAAPGQAVVAGTGAQSVDGADTRLEVSGCTADAQGKDGVSVVRPYVQGAGAGATAMASSGRTTAGGNHTEAINANGAVTAGHEATVPGGAVDATVNQALALGLDAKVAQIHRVALRTESPTAAPGVGTMARRDTIALATHGVGNEDTAGTERQVRYVAPDTLAETRTDAVDDPQSLPVGKADGTNTSAHRVAAITGIDDQGVAYFHINSVGPGSQAFGLDAIAIGPDSMSTGTGSVAVGVGAQTAQDSSVAIGDQAATLGTAGVAIGHAVASGVDGQNVAIGSGGTIANADSVAGGAVAIGRGQIAKGDGAVALGDPNTAFGTGAVALGADNVAAGDVAGTVAADGAVAIGNANMALGQGTLAMGNGSTVSGSGGIALGDTARATGGAVAIGRNAQSLAVNTVAVGVNARADFVNDVAFGTDAHATGTATGLAPSTAFGNRATASGEADTAFGSLATASGGSSLALGYGATSSGISSAAFGTQSMSTAKNSVALGGFTYADGDFSTAVGGATATAVKSVAIGDDTRADALAVNGVALGTNAIVSTARSVALGDASVTVTAVGTVSDLIDGTVYLYAGAAPVGTVSVGGIGDERTLTNLAAGRVGAGSTDAVNGSQLAATNTALENLSDNAVQYDDSGKGIVTLGGVGAAAPVVLTHVADGALAATSTDAVNGSQLHATNQNVATNTTRIANNTTAIVNLDGRVSTIEGGITNISTGSAGMFQVSQDHNAPPPTPTGTNSAAGGAHAAALGDASLAVGNDSTAAGNGSSALGNGATASGHGSTAIGQGAAATAVGSVALGSGASDGGRGAESYTGKYSGVQNASAGTVSVGNAVAGETRTVGNVADGRQATDAVNLRQLDGAVRAANDYTDTQIANLNGGVIDFGDTVHAIQHGADGMFQVSPDANTTKPKATGTHSTAGGNGAVASGSNGTALGHGAQATAANSVALGADAVADRADSVSVGVAGGERQITHVAAGTAPTDAVNVGQLQASQAGNVQYASHADGSADYGHVTLNPGGDPTAIHNLRAGTANTDAVNVEQLNQGLNTVQDWSRNYTDQRFNAIDRDLRTVGNRANGGVASAMAMASLPQAYQPNQSSAAVALGSFHGQTGIAVGMSTISESGRYVFKLNATTNSWGDAGVGVGAGVVW